MATIVLLTLLTAIVGVGCSTPASETSPVTSVTETTATSSSQLEPIIVPTMPNIIPGYLEIDPDTELHMTGKPTVVDFDNYQLKVGGLVDQELNLTYDEIRLLPKLTASPQLVCQGFFVDIATWSGASLDSILEMAKMRPEATSITLTSADGYKTNVSLEIALNPNNFLAYKLAGETLPVLHGFPIRAVFPGQDGYYWVKWLIEIEVK